MFAFGDVHHYPHQAVHPSHGIFNGGLAEEVLPQFAIRAFDFRFVKLGAGVLDELHILFVVAPGKLRRNVFRQVKEAFSDDVALFKPQNHLGKGFVAAKIDALAIFVVDGAGHGIQNRFKSLVCVHHLSGVLFDGLVQGFVHFCEKIDAGFEAAVVTEDQNDSHKRGHAPGDEKYIEKPVGVVKLNEGKPACGNKKKEQ